MSDVFIPPYQSLLEAQEFRAFIYSDENAQHIRWWRAVVDPAFNRATGKATPQANTVKWLHEEQDVSRFQAIISDARVARRYYPQGSFVLGDLVMMTMPDEIPVDDHDWVCPIGGASGEARLLRSKEPMIRGARIEAGEGTASSAGNVIVGTGTAFSTFLRHGDILDALGQQLRITSISSDTALLLESAPSPAWSGNSYSRRRDLLTYYPAADIEEIRDADGLYIPADDFLLVGERTVNWAGRSPAPGATFSIVYRYYPRYQVVPNMILGSHGIRKLPQPIVATLRLFKPDALQE